MHENDLLEKLPALFATDDPSVVVGTGPDDCAHVVSPDARIAFSADSFVENVHFLPDDPPEDIAYKALTAAASDLAASACQPKWALVCLCLRKGTPPDWVARFAQSLAAAARYYGVSVIGGDTTSAPNDTVISVTVSGVPLPGGPLLRSGSKAGDVIVVTGRLGGSLLGRHLRPVARVREIAALMDFCTSHNLPYPTACMDISDGLALDLSRMCRESGTGATLEMERIPLSPAAGQMASRTGKHPLAHALSDGEDFELLLTMPVQLWREFSRTLSIAGGSDEEKNTPLFTRIGEMTATGELLLSDANGACRPLSAGGYEHKW